MTNYYQTPQSVQAQVYGTPPQQQGQSARLQPGQQPNFANLSDGGRTPVSEFVGQYNGFDPQETQYGQNLIFHFINCQILDADNAYPYDTVDVSMRYSESKRSSYGMFGESLGAALKIPMEQVDLNLLVGHFFHMIREDNHTYGTNAQTGQVMAGTVWHVYEMAQPGAPVNAVRHVVFTNQKPVAQQPAQQSVTQQQFAANPGQVIQPVVNPQAQQLVAQFQQAQPGIQVPQQQVQQQVVQPQVTQQQVIQPQIQQQVQPTAQAVSVVDPNVRALELLNGKSQSEFTRDVMSDAVIRGSQIFTDILNNQWIASMEQQGFAVLQADGTYAVAQPTQ